MKFKQIDREGCTNSVIKHIISLILSFAMLLSIAVKFNLPAYAYIKGESNNYKYRSISIGIDDNGDDIYNDDYIEIISYNGNDSHISIPESLDSRIVKKIGQDAFCEATGYGADGYDFITSIYIPDTVDIISNGAFCACENLKSIRLSSNLKKLYNSVFLNCISLSNIILPDKLEYIGMTCFSGCENLTSISIPKCVNFIGPWAFENCSKLSDVYYAGSIEDWNKIFIGANNECLKNANIHYNYNPVANNKFSDIQSSEYVPYSDYVMYTSVYNNFINGTNPPYYTEFSPNQSITRAMFVTILYRMAGEPYKNANPYKSSPFTDIKDTSVYYYDAACWALDNNITTQITFKPYDNVSREQTASFLFRYAKENDMLGDEEYKNVNLSVYHDYDNIRDWSKEAMQWANYNGMITGTQQGYANPQGSTLRIHATKILYGFGKACNIGNFE